MPFNHFNLIAILPTWQGIMFVVYVCRNWLVVQSKTVPKGSPNIMLAHQCINFEHKEYWRGLINFDKAIEEGVIEVESKSQSGYVEPRKNRERSRLYELYIGLFQNETPGRVFNLKKGYELIEKLATELKKPTK